MSTVKRKGYCRLQGLLLSGRKSGRRALADRPHINAYPLCLICRQISGLVETPSPPAEKATARQDQTGKAGTSDGAGDAHACDSVVEYCCWAYYGLRWRFGCSGRCPMTFSIGSEVGGFIETSGRAGHIKMQRSCKINSSRPGQ